MSNAADLAISIDGYEAALVRINDMIDSGNSSTELVVVRASVTVIITILKDVYRVKATDEINQFITPGFNYFNSTNSLSFDVLRPIYDAVLGCKNSANPDTELPCLVQLTASFTQIDEAVKQRIILEVTAIMVAHGLSYNPSDTDVANIIASSTASQLYDGSGNPSSSTSGVPFKYNRQAAALYAKTTSQNNFRLFSNGGFPQGDEDIPSVVGLIARNGIRNYSASLDHTPLGTGSSIFISECIFAGGMPMTVRVGANPIENHCTTPSEDAQESDLGSSNDGYANKGWRFCSDQHTATQTWKNHQGIIKYFTDSNGGLGGQPLGSIILNDIINVVYTTPDSLSFDPGNLKQDQGSSYETAKDALIAKLNTPPLNALSAGDYIYIDVDGGDNHGLFVAGWGPLFGTKDAITYALSNQLSPQRASLDSTHVIPYVADFCFGYRTQTQFNEGRANGQNIRDSSEIDDRVGWLQDPRPRPFYSTRVLITDRPEFADNFLADQLPLLRRIHYPPDQSNPDAAPFVIAYQEFTCLQWSFFKLPDIVHIPFVRLFRG